jgi:myo-inositol-1(or 4)-monophosphatase
MTGACFNLGSAAFDMTRVAAGQLDAYVDVGRRVLDEEPRTEPAFVALGDGTPCVNFPYDVAAATLILEEAGGVVTQADGRPLDTHPAVGSSREHGLSVVAAGNPALHRALLEAVDRGMARLGEWLMGAQSRGLL